MQKSPQENNNILCEINKSICEVNKQNEEIVTNAATIILCHHILKAIHASVIPRIHAAQEPKPPTKPPKMKYKDLPVYQSPHYEYKDYISDKEKCPGFNEKLIQTKLYPIVHRYRMGLAESLGGLKDEICLISKEIYEAVCARTRLYKKCMRDPENMTARQATVTASTLAGLYLGSGRGCIKKMFFSTLGALAGGALCFPKETDELFRNFSYYFGKFMICAFNKACRQNYSLRERLPCPDDLPAPPQPLPPDKINKKCNEKKK